MGQDECRAGAAAWNESEDLYNDKDLDATSKLAVLAHSVRKFLEQEAVNVLHAAEPLAVSGHTTFGRMKAVVLRHCTCSLGSSQDQTPDACELHCCEPSVNDLVWSIASTIFHKFDDEFTCFANLFVEQHAQSPWH